MNKNKYPEAKEGERPLGAKVEQPALTELHDITVNTNTGTWKEIKVHNSGCPYCKKPMIIVTYNNMQQIRIPPLAIPTYGYCIECDKTFVYLPEAKEKEQ